MLLNYTGSFGTIVDATKKEIAIVSTIIHNPKDIAVQATITLNKGSNTIVVFDSEVDSKESLFLETKLFLSNADTLSVSGASFIFSGSEENV